MPHDFNPSPQPGSMVDDRPMSHDRALQHMRHSRRRWLQAAAVAALSPVGAVLAQTSRAQPAATGDAMVLSFRGTDYLHRWSKNDQHEFTPKDDADLAKWRDMITLNVHAATRTGDQLAEVANKVLGNYQKYGKVLQTRSKPRAANHPAEHLIVAVLGSPQGLEATFARCMLHDGSGFIAVASHRVLGQAAGPEMSKWLAENGAKVEQALMTSMTLPAVSSLQRLPVKA